LIAFGFVAVAALVVEAGIVALLLAFSGLSTTRVFAGFLVMNMMIFFLLFCPLLGELHWSLLEILVVIVDGVFIKLLAGFGSFQNEGYRGVTFVRAGVISAIGNAMSFFVGVIAAGAPWITHPVVIEE